LKCKENVIHELKTIKGFARRVVWLRCHSKNVRSVQKLIENWYNQGKRLLH